MENVLDWFDRHVEDLRVTDAGRVRTQTLLLLIFIVNGDVQPLVIVDDDQLSLGVELDVGWIGDVVGLFDFAHQLSTVREHFDRVQVIVGDEDLVVVRADRRRKLQLRIEMEEGEHFAFEREDVQLLHLRLDDDDAV